MCSAAPTTATAGFRLYPGVAPAAAFAVQIKDEFQTGGAVAQLGQRMCVGHCNVWMGDTGADIPSTVDSRCNLAATAQRCKPWESRFIMFYSDVVSCIERFNPDAIQGGGHQNLVEVTPLDCLIDLNAPGLTGGFFEFAGQY